MKTQQIFLPILLFVCSITFAQTKTTFSQPVVKGVKETYSVKNSPSMRLKQVYNLNDNLGIKRYKIDENYIPLPTDIKIDHKAILKIFDELFNHDRLQQLADDTGNLLINFEVTHSGKILSVDYAFKPSSTLTAEEIEKIESRLKNEVAISINPKSYPNYNYITATSFVSFKSMLNNQPKKVF